MATPTTEASGLLLVDKPAGITSHDVVAIVRRALRTRRVGHAGTLDPFATGLLVVLFGRGTRLIPYVDGEPKVYEARHSLRRRDRHRRSHRRRRRARPSRRPTRRSPTAIAQLTGDDRSGAAGYSAKQVDGTRAYDAARRGDAARARRRCACTVHAWTLVAPRRRSISPRASPAAAARTFARSRATSADCTDSAAHLAELATHRSRAVLGRRCRRRSPTSRAATSRSRPLAAAIPSTCRRSRSTATSCGASFTAIRSRRASTARASRWSTIDGDAHRGRRGARRRAAAQGWCFAMPERVGLPAARGRIGRHRRHVRRCAPRSPRHPAARRASARGRRAARACS